MASRLCDSRAAASCSRPAAYTKVTQRGGEQPRSPGFVASAASCSASGRSLQPQATHDPLSAALAPSRPGLPSQPSSGLLVPARPGFPLAPARPVFPPRSRPDSRPGPDRCGRQRAAGRAGCCRARWGAGNALARCAASGPGTSSEAAPSPASAAWWQRSAGQAPGPARPSGNERSGTAGAARRGWRRGRGFGPAPSAMSAGSLRGCRPDLALAGASGKCPRVEGWRQPVGGGCSSLASGGSPDPASVSPLPTIACG